MTSIDIAPSGASGSGASAGRARLSASLSPDLVRPALLGVIAACFVGGILATDAVTTSAAVASAGDDLTRLLRFMAAIKAVLAIGAAGAVVWRLGIAVTPARFAAYAVACGGMVAGPGLIWGMAHVGLGALLLHGGLFATVVLLWRDPAVAARMEAILAARQLCRPIARR